MKRVAPLLFLLPVCAFAQNQSGNSAAMKLAKTASMNVESALKVGKTVTISVDNRMTDYTARIVGGRLMIPARLFRETGQKVVWENFDKRGYIRDDSDPRRSVDMDAREPRDNRPSPTMRPYLKKGMLWVPLVQTVMPLGHTLTWVPSSNRLNISTNRASNNGTNRS